MGARGPLPKPPERSTRHGRPAKAKPSAKLAVIPSQATADPPEGLLPENEAEWRSLWNAPVSQAIKPHHLPALRRLFKLRDKFDRAMLVVDEALMVAGSMGQSRVSPALETAIRLDAACTRAENELGLTPMGEARLGQAVGQAHLTLEELNRAANGRANARTDPRIALVEQSDEDSRGAAPS